MTQQNSNALVTDDFGNFLAGEITSASVRSGIEWVIPLRHMIEAVNIATEHLIAVLGVEAFRISRDGLGTVGCSGYEFRFEGDWGNFVSQNNQAAEQYVTDHQFGDGYGYILTITSAEAFSHLTDQIK